MYYCAHFSSPILLPALIQKISLKLLLLFISTPCKWIANDPILSFLCFGITLFFRLKSSFKWTTWMFSYRVDVFIYFLHSWNNFSNDEHALIQTDVLIYFLLSKIHVKSRLRSRAYKFELPISMLFVLKSMIYLLNYEHCNLCCLLRIIKIDSIMYLNFVL